MTHAPSTTDQEPSQVTDGDNAVTDEPKDTQPQTDKLGENGCKSAVGGSATALLTAIAATVAMKKSSSYKKSREQA